MKSGWWTPRSITLHVALVVVVPSFLLLGLWQLSRAVHGNVLSWAYTFEWPFFAAYATWMWWKLVHEEVTRCSAPPAAAAEAGTGRQRGLTTPPNGPAEGAPLAAAGVVAPGDTPAGEAAIAAQLGWNPYDDEADPQLAAYNRYLASLHTGEAAGDAVGDGGNAPAGERTGQRRR